MSHLRDFEPILDHIHVQVRDLEASRPFYRAVVRALGLQEEWEEADDHLKFREFYLDQTDGQVTHAHFAFRATSQEQVRTFHRLAIEAGGQDNGEPGYRKYHNEYYGAFVLDPDGNNVEVVYNGDLIPRES